MQDTENTPPEVPPSRPKARHWLVLLSFIVMVAGPVAGIGWYLWERAYDRYVSRVSFSVRTEEVGSAIEMLGGIAELSGSSSSDTDILYKFIQSHELVRLIDDRLDLRSLWAKADPEQDPYFAYHPPGTIEDLLEYWQRTVKVYNDSSTSGLIDIEVNAFTPEDAHRIASAVYDESSAMINRLSAIAQEDATRYARDELTQSIERLKQARSTLTRFRNVNQIVDPNASISSQMGLLSSLQFELAETMIDLNMLSRQTARKNDPRVLEANRRAEVIRNLIAEERRKIGIDPTQTEAGTAFADIVGEYENLEVEREFAEQAYIAALAAYDAANAEARRQSLYLAAHVRPTLAEAPEEPKRLTLLLLCSLFLFLIWAILVLAAYAIKDRR